MGRDTRSAANLGGLGKCQGPDGRWMLKLIYPNAVNLDSYLEVWLRGIMATAPASRSAKELGNFAEPASYLSRPEDGLEFKQVGRLSVVENGSLYLVDMLGGR